MPGTDSSRQRRGLCCDGCAVGASGMTNTWSNRSTPGVIDPLEELIYIVN
jgi:hypothetical protein